MASISISPVIRQNIQKSAIGALTVLGASGNARGSNAVDLQQVNNGTTQVASGAQSSILGGANNTASGASSTASGSYCAASQIASTASGLYCTASGIASTASGSHCTASGSFATASGSYCAASNTSATASGTHCTASGSASTVSGHYCTASGTYSFATGSRSVASLFGQISHAGGRFSADGDAQISNYVMRRTTGANATPVALFLNGSSSNLTLASNRTLACFINIAATTGTDSAQFIRQVVISNISGTTALVGSVGTIGSDIKSSGATLWVVAITADDTGDFLKITGEGGVGNTSAIKFVARVETVEIGF